MKIENVKIKKLRDDAIVPTYGSEFSAGADLYACVDEDVVIGPSETVLIKLGFSAELPEGYAGLIYARSGLATKKNLAPANKVGVVDSDYRGEWMVPLHNHGTVPQTIEKGERIAQMIITPYVKAAFLICDELEETERGAGGFGSTGTK